VKEQVSVLLQRFNVPNRAALSEAGTAFIITGTPTIEPAWLQYLFSEAPVMIAMLRGPEHAIEIANEAFRRACAGRDFMGRSMRDVFPEISGEMLATYEEVYASGVPAVRHEMPARFLRDGHPQPGFGSFVFQPLRGEDDRVNGVMVFCLDVTEQVRARERLAELAAEHLAVLDQVPSSVLVFNAEGRVIKINEAGRRLVGTTLLGTTPLEREKNGALRDAAGGPLKVRQFPSTRALCGETVDLDLAYEREGQLLALHARDAVASDGWKHPRCGGRPLPGLGLGGGQRAIDLDDELVDRERLPEDLRGTDDLRELMRVLAPADDKDRDLARLRRALPPSRDEVHAIQFGQPEVEDHRRWTRHQRRAEGVRPVDRRDDVDPALA
jgi:PAS domain-containing protein